MLRSEQRHSWGDEPSWFPDGKTIIFDSDYRRTKATINSLFTIKLDGSA
jgi:Tol biopolymer transport system component